MAVKTVYDVVVVGSGASGGVAAFVLASKGLKVLCLEAGRMIEPAQDFHNHRFPFEWPYRGNGKPGKYGSLPQGRICAVRRLEASRILKILLHVAHDFFGNIGCPSGAVSHDRTIRLLRSPRTVCQSQRGKVW